MERIQPVDSKQWPCSAVVFHAALPNLYALCGLYLSHFSTDWAEILHDCSLGGKDQVYRVKTMTLQHCSIPCRAAESLNTLTTYISAISQRIELKFCMMTLYVERIKSRVKRVTLQHCSIPCSAAESLNTLQLISQPYLNGLSWNFAWWLSRWKGSSLESKQWPCSTRAFHAALQNLLTLNSLYLSDPAALLSFIWSYSHFKIQSFDCFYCLWSHFIQSSSSPKKMTISPIAVSVVSLRDTTGKKHCCSLLVVWMWHHVKWRHVCFDSELK